MMITARSLVMRQKQNTNIVLLVLQSVVLGKWREDQPFTVFTILPYYIDLHYMYIRNATRIEANTKIWNAIS